MTPTARLQATLELLEEVIQTPKPADALTSAYFRRRRYIGSKDRAAVSDLLYSLLRHHARLNWWLDRNFSPVLKKEATSYPARTYLLAYLVLAEKKNLTSLSELFNGGKFAPSRLTDEERTLLSKLVNHTIEHPDMPEEVKGECPAWAVPSMKATFGKHFLHETLALLESAPLDLRVNILKTDRETALRELKELGLKASAGPLSPYAIRVEERPSLSSLSLLKQGLVEIQDEGSQLVALLVDAHPGQRVVDFCAGAGGKTLAIAAMMENKGRIIACDVLAGRLRRSTERFRRAGLHNIEVKPLTSETDPWVKKHKGSFDRVLVDAPCSGTGTWRRNPDARWRTLGPGLDKLCTLQANILASAARLVKPGGRLIYATCSVLPEENEEQIKAFIALHNDFRLLPLNEATSLKLPSRHKDYLALTPARHKTDGFFAAILERKPQE